MESGLKLGSQKEAYPVRAGNEDQGSKPSNAVEKNLVYLVFTREKMLREELRNQNIHEKSICENLNYQNF